MPRKTPHPNPLLKEEREQIGDYLSTLTKHQREAVTFGGKALMIVAGAGTGKTTVLTRRIAWLVEQGIKPEKILALTFTDKAAREMETRVDELLPYGTFGVEISTFHSFCQKLLQQYPIYSHVSESSLLLTEAEQRLFWQNHIMEFPLKNLRPLSNLAANVPSMMHFISRCKDELINPKILAEWVKTQCPDEDKPLYSELSDAYTFYQALIRKMDVLDYGELLLRTDEILTKHKSLQVKVRETYSHILIDEYQDTNHAQIEIIKLFATKNHSITAVGDDDQSIYRFRGAAVGQMEAFTKHFNAKVVSLTDNFRSGQNILNTAYELIQHNNPHRLESKLGISKKLVSAVKNDSNISSQIFATDGEEADWIAQNISRKIASGSYTHDDFCILVRTNRQSREFMQSLGEAGVPFTTESDIGLAGNPTIQLMLNFLKSAVNPLDHLAVYFLASSPAYNIPGSVLTPLLAKSRATHESLESQMTNTSGAKPLIADLERARNLIPNSHVGIVVTSWLQSHPWWQKITTDAQFEKEQSAVLTFLRLIHQFERTAVKTDLFTFLESVQTLLTDYSDTAGESGEVRAVRLYTVHQSKGLEFPVVYVTNLTKDRFPTIDRHSGFEVPTDLINNAAKEGEHNREERRLLYVASTRAKNELIFTRAERYGTTKPRPASPFWRELGFVEKPDVEIRDKLKKEQPENQKKLVSSTRTPSLVLSVSPHSLDDYDKCPLRYRYRYIDGIPGPYDQNQMIGQCIHKAIEHYFIKRMAGEKLGARELEKVVEGCFSPRGFISKDHADLRKAETLKQIADFTKTFDALPVPSAIEKSFTIAVDSAVLRGRIDAVFDKPLPGIADDARTIILDFKTTDRVTTQKQADERAADSLQLRLYALAWEEQHGTLPDACGLYFTHSGLFGWTNPTRKKIDNSRQKILQIVADIQASRFEPTPDPFTCAVCPFKSFCPFSQAPTT